MTTKFAAALALLGTIICSPAMATTYAVNDTDGDYTVVGTITTNGKLGVLAASDIVDWTLTLSTPFTMTPANSTVTITGNHLTATATALLFDYTAEFAEDKFFFFTNGGELQAHVGYQNFGFNFDIGACYSGDLCLTSLGVFRSGVGVIAGTAGSTAPLPAGLPLFATGLGVLALLGRRRKRML